MFKFLTIFIFAILGFAAAKPNPQVFVAPEVAEVVSPYVVSTSSQYVARNFNGFPVAYAAGSPVVSAYSAYPYYF